MNEQTNNPMLDLASKYLPPQAALRLSNLAAQLLSAPVTESTLRDLGSVFALLNAAVEWQPDNPEILLTLSAALDQIPSLDAAHDMLAVCERAMTIVEEDDMPGSVPAVAFYNRSLARSRTYDTVGALLDAVAAVDTAQHYAHGDDLAVFHVNLANAYHWRRRYADAVDALGAAIAISTPGTESLLRAKLARASLLMGLGYWQKGFDDFRDRHHLYKTEDSIFRHNRVWNRDWDSGLQGLRGMRVLVALEQGLGDQLQSAQLLPWFNHEVRPASITVSCSRAILKLIGGMGCVHQAVPDVNPTPHPYDYDAVVRVLDLMEERHRLDLFPLGDNVRSYLCPPAHEVEDILGRYIDNPPVEPKPPEGSGALRVALQWHGNPKHQQDWARSCPLEHFYQLALSLREAGVDIDWYSFQPYPDGVDLFRGWDRAVVPLHDCRYTGSPISDMGDTAIWLTRVDVMVGIDSGQCHLAAAATSLPVIFLHAYVGDYRWQYADRLYGGECQNIFHIRQPEPGDWAGVMDRLRDKLAALSADHYCGNADWDLPEDTEEALCR